MADHDRNDDPTGDLPMTGSFERRLGRRRDDDSPFDAPPGDLRDVRADDADRDPTALAAWRRVAEQRRRRQQAAVPPDDAVLPEGPVTPAVTPAEPARSEVADGPGPDLDRHEILLALAGRVDDDALSSVRELVAVEDDDGAAELLGGCLLAGAVAVTGTERAALGRWFAGARVDPDLVGALPADPEAGRRPAHRFAAELPGDARRDGHGDEVARVAERLPGVRHVRQCWRLTPAGAVPGPVPHRVVLVETDSADDREQVTHHVAYAARSLGAVSVEVFATGATLPAYHRDALAVAVALTPDVTSDEAVPEVVAEPDERWQTVADSRPSGARASHRRAAPDPQETAQETAQETVVPAVEERADPLPARRARREEPDDQPVDAVGDRAIDDFGDRDRRDRDRRDRDEAPEVDLDADGTAARIAALWRQPPAVDALDAPLSGPLQPTDLEPEGRAGLPTGDIPVVMGHDAQDGPAPGHEPGRIQRARHSRGSSDDDPSPTPSYDQDARGGLPWAGADPRTGSRRDPLLASPVDLGESDGPAIDDADRTGPANGHRRGSGRARDPITGPIPRTPPEPAEPELPAGIERPPWWRDPTPTDPTLDPGSGHRPAVDDTGDAASSQLSERERELLARLHEELAARERLDPYAVDPLMGGEPRTEDHRRPLMGRANGHGPTNGTGRTNGTNGVNGHGLNGHDLPRRYGPSSDDD